MGKSGYIQLSSDSSSLNVRTGAGTDYAVAFTVKSGTKLTVLSDYGSWYGVEISGKTGYVSAQYVKLDSSSASGSSSSSQSTATTTSAVNLRSIGSTSGEKLGTYSKGTTVHRSGKGRQLVQGAGGHQDGLHEEQLPLLLVRGDPASTRAAIPA